MQRIAASRIIILVLFVIGVVFYLIGLAGIVALFSLLQGQADATAFGQVKTLIYVGMVLGALVYVLDLVAVILLFRRDSSAWFKSQLPPAVGETFR